MPIGVHTYWPGGHLLVRTPIGQVDLLVWTRIGQVDTYWCGHLLARWGPTGVDTFAGPVSGAV